MTALALTIVLLAGGADASAEPFHPQPAERCRELSDAAARLACYDAALGAPAAGEPPPAAHPLAFGLKPARPKIQPDRVERISLTVAKAWRAANGDWKLAMTDGQVWRQVDGRVARAPRAGSTAQIRRAAMGSYLMTLDGQTAVRALREK